MVPDTRLAHIIAQSLDLRSALGLHTAALIRVLGAAGWAVTLDIQDQRAVPAEMRPLLSQVGQPDGTRGDSSVSASAASLTILEYPIWFPHAERFREATDTAVFWYHGVTPPALWGSREGGDVLRRSEAGTELAWYAHLAVADSPFVAQELIRHSGYPVERIRIAPIGVDLSSLRRHPVEAELNRLRERLSLQRRRVLLYVGRVAGNKRLDLLVEALALLGAPYADLCLLIVGDDSSLPAYRDLALRLRAQAVERGVGDRVIFTGRVESTQPYYHLADVCVLPSQHEGFGVPLVEAMAIGVPVVASASGAMTWVLDAEDAGDEPAGLVSSPGDANDLAMQIARVLSDPELHATLIERGRRRAEFFSIEQFEVRTRDVLAEAASLAREGPPPGVSRHVSGLHQRADVALRDYRVRSNVPVLGPLIEWLRVSSTTHVKEAYLDRVIEQQVLFNRELVAEIMRLQGEVNDLRDQLARLLEREASS